MAKKTRSKKNEPEHIFGDIVAEIRDQKIDDAVRTNYMPYAMSVIVSRAIPDIDGFKPSQRKLLYTMYKMGLMTGPKTKSTNVVGQTMHLNPHGDASIYETMVRMTTGNGTFLHPFIESKGTFGRHDSQMPPAAARYTEVKLDKFSAELFGGIDKNAVDMIPNFDNTTVEPQLLPTSFPNILIAPTLGVAVGLQSQICSFNLAEICDGTTALLKNPKLSVEKLMEIVKAPDFSVGGDLIYDYEQMKQIYETGNGTFKLRARYTFDKTKSIIEINEIPFTTDIEKIIAKITDLIKENRLREISDVRDEIGLEGFKLAIDIKRGTDPDALMNKLYKYTPLEDTYACNFNVLINGSTRLLGVKDILTEWITFRMGCVRRELTFDLNKKKDKLHLLLGLGKILIDIDKAIKIVRETERESEVVPRLMEGFRIDQLQAEYIAEIKLRHLNREYIVERIKEIDALKKEIADLETILADDIKIKGVIAAQLQQVKAKYGKPRRTGIVSDVQEYIPAIEEKAEEYQAYMILTKEGYFKKIKMTSLMKADEQKLKEGDEITNEEENSNTAELIFFTDQAQAYKAKADDFAPVKASALGDFVASKLQFSEGERPVMMKALKEYNPKDNFIFIFENGKGLKVPVTAYETKSNRKKLTAAYSSVSPIVAVIYEHEPLDLLIRSTQGRAILISSRLIPVKTTRSSQGVTVFTLKKGNRISSVEYAEKIDAAKAPGCRKIKIPASGVALDEQIKLV
ncbi:MAG: topoisomerase IV [Clostridia bacterium]|nr:topoisomerase IV [Clostridia bacterium]